MRNETGLGIPTIDRQAWERNQEQCQHHRQETREESPRFNERWCFATLKCLLLRIPILTIGCHWNPPLILLRRFSRQSQIASSLSLDVPRLLCQGTKWCVTESCYFFASLGKPLTLDSKDPAQRLQRGRFRFVEESKLRCLCTKSRYAPQRQKPKPWKNYPTEAHSVE